MKYALAASLLVLLVSLAGCVTPAAIEREPAEVHTGDALSVNQVRTDTEKLLAFIGVADREAMGVILLLSAAVLYHQQNGQWPESLEDLEVSAEDKDVEAPLDFLNHIQLFVTDDGYLVGEYEGGSDNSKEALEAVRTMVLRRSEKRDGLYVLSCTLGRIESESEWLEWEIEPHEDGDVSITYPYRY